MSSMDIRSLPIPTPNDCAAYHNLLAVDEANPKLMSELNLQ